ncbi:MAG: hypothetical protein COA45_04100 [Zetaproteobacteria bacterium]|nr:MAG: hypothetical protein COA45_04100 [Zetaproteobacteria bacterium]
MQPIANIMAALTFTGYGTLKMKKLLFLGINILIIQTFLAGIFLSLWINEIDWRWFAAFLGSSLLHMSFLLTKSLKNDLRAEIKKLTKANLLQKRQINKLKSEKNTLNHQSSKTKEE